MLTIEFAYFGQAKKNGVLCISTYINCWVFEGEDSLFKTYRDKIVTSNQNHRIIPI